MTKLLMVTTVPITLNGFLLPFARYFRNQGWQVDAMSLQTSAMSECVENFDNVWDVDFSRNPLDPQNLIVAPRQIQQVLEKQEYDIVHVHTAVAAFVTRLAFSRLKKQPKPKLIYTVHGFHFFRGNKFTKNAIFLTFEKIAAPWTDYMVVINGEDEEAAKRHRLISPERLYYMPGIGVDLNYYNPDQVSQADIQAVRKEIGLESEDVMILASAEFNPGKRHRDMLRAFAKLGRPNVHLAFAGTGPLFEEMQGLAADLGIKKQVHFLGHRRDMPTLMRASIATLMASEREGLPRSVMESLCLETPVIGADTRGIRDLLADGCGLIVPVGDIEGFAAAMTWVVNNPEAARQTAKRGKERMNNYDVRHIIKLHENLYADVMEKQPVHC
ncbi:glycosyl transferase family 1 [Dulcicalothrix desertica PCC 7102]|uniref:Glycosyl transferase family 1 n=1 Tax=Dulcicalothrix desertica PCC 7102 TaxID=232991 RepID=A0A3S1C9Y4_9CYAN|nr:glycosyltransferase [Dulcicalothrix desertica]RUT03103.1 glycosyl transferase family 1 [Dulcicalothrix desertica PCC 7102]TWH53478.1 glycosyltransferase involved in cell wall biosynthesis [Dulcicalothrix desertica PCC 7102]